MKRLVLLIMLLVCVVSFTVPAFGHVQKDGVVFNGGDPKDPPK
jgi:hypothetical protein